MDGVSYIVTVYNKLPFLPLVLGALFAQTGDFAREFVIIDDGSTDGSWEELQRLARHRPEVKLLRQANAGPAVATNVAVRAASLPWLKIVDADDVLSPHCTELLLDAARRFGLRLARGHTMDYRLGDPIDFADAAVSGNAMRQENLYAACLKNVPCNLSPLLIHRALYWEAGGCDERLFTQDYSLLLRLTWRSWVAEVMAPLVASPVEAPGRVSDNQCRMLRDTNHAMLLFLSETPGLPWHDRRRGTERAFGRAWKWQRRRIGAPTLRSRWFWLYALAQIAPPDLLRPLLPSTLAAFVPPASRASSGELQPAAGGG
jgi:hypothetical protein